jgi:hypothetical protein
MSAYRHVPCPLHLKITSSESLHPVVTTLRFPGAGGVELVDSIHWQRASDERSLAALGRGAGRNAGAGAPPACARASGRVLDMLFTPWCPPPAARRARHPPRAPCARQEDEFVVDQAGVPGDTRERRRPATARGPRDRYGAGLSGYGSLHPKLAVPAQSASPSALPSLRSLLRTRI